MGLTTNTDYSALCSMINKLGSYSGNNGSAAWYSNGMDVWTYYDQLQEGDETQKAEAIQGLLQRAISLIGGNRNSQAKQTAAANEKKAKQNEQKLKKTEAEINKDIAKVNADISANQANIAALMEEIAKTQTNMTDLAEKVEEVKKQIEAKQEELKTAKTDEDKKRILEELQGLADNLAELNTTLTDLSEAVKNSESEKENLQNTTEQLNTKKAEVEDKGEQKLQIAATEALDLSKQNQQALAQSIQDKAASIEFRNLKEAAQNASYFGASAAVEFGRKEMDAEQASSTGERGYSTVQTSTVNTTQNLTRNVGQITNFSNGAVGSLTEMGNFLGDVASTLEPLIEGVGTGEGLITTSDELRSATEEDLAQLNAQPEEIEETEEQDGQEGQGENSEMKTTQVDIKPLEDVKLDVA